MHTPSKSSEGGAPTADASTGAAVAGGGAGAEEEEEEEEASFDAALALVREGSVARPGIGMKELRSAARRGEMRGSESVERRRKEESAF